MLDQLFFLEIAATASLVFSAAYVALAVQETALASWELSTSAPLLSAISASVAFLFCSHVRALWHVPKWTSSWNIFVDLGTGVMAVRFVDPSIWGIMYVAMHFGFLSMFLLDKPRFSGLFEAARAFSLIRLIYNTATFFEMGWQLRHLVLHGRLDGIAAGLIIYASICLWFEWFERRPGPSATARQRWRALSHAVRFVKLKPSSLSVTPTPSSQAALPETCTPVRQKPSGVSAAPLLTRHSSMQDSEPGSPGLERASMAKLAAAVTLGLLSICLPYDLTPLVYSTPEAIALSIDFYRVACGSVLTAPLGFLLMIVTFADLAYHAAKGYTGAQKGLCVLLILLPVQIALSMDALSFLQGSPGSTPSVAAVASYAKAHVIEWSAALAVCKLRAPNGKQENV